MASPMTPAARTALIALLGALAAMSPLTLSIHVQSIPQLATDLDVDYSVIQLTISA